MTDETKTPEPTADELSAQAERELSALKAETERLAAENAALDEQRAVIRAKQIEINRQLDACANRRAALHLLKTNPRAVQVLMPGGVRSAEAFGRPAVK